MYFLHMLLENWLNQNPRVLDRSSPAKELEWTRLLRRYPDLFQSFMIGLRLGFKVLPLEHCFATFPMSHGLSSSWIKVTSTTVSTDKHITPEQVSDTTTNGSIIASQELNEQSKKSTGNTGVPELASEKEVSTNNETPSAPKLLASPAK